LTSSASSLGRVDFRCRTPVVELLCLRFSRLSSVIFRPPDSSVTILFLSAVESGRRGLGFLPLHVLRQTLKGSLPSQDHRTPTPGASRRPFEGHPPPPFFQGRKLMDLSSEKQYLATGRSFHKEDHSHEGDSNPPSLASFPSHPRRQE